MTHLLGRIRPVTVETRLPRLFHVKQRDSGLFAKGAMAKGLGIVKRLDEHDAAFHIALFYSIEQLTGKMGKILCLVCPGVLGQLMHPAGETGQAVNQFFVRQRRIHDLVLDLGKYRLEITFRGLEFHHRCPSLETG